MASRTVSQARPERPLLVTDDAHLLDEVLRIAARADVEVDVAPDPVAARRMFAGAPLVLVGSGLAAACARLGLPRRPGVILVAVASGEDPPWQLAQTLGAEHIALLPAAEPWLLDRLAAADVKEQAARIVAVAGGRGGAGATVLAAALAVTAARHGHRALLVDADPLGGGVDLVLGWETLDGLRWPAIDRGGDERSPMLVGALPNQGQLAVLSWDRGEFATVTPSAMESALEAGRRGCDLVVLDLPRRLDEAAALAVAAAVPVLLVVPAELRACAAAGRVAASMADYTTNVEVIVRGPAPGRLKAKEIARALGLPLAGVLSVEPGLPAALERGEPPAGTGKGPLADLCGRLLGGFGLDDLSRP